MQLSLFQNWNCPAESSCFSTGKKGHERDLRGFQWKFRTFVRQGKAPRTVETLSKRRGRGGEKMKNRKIEKKKMGNRRDAEQRKTKPEKFTCWMAVDPLAVRNRVVMAGKRLWERMPCVEGFSGVTSPLFISLLPHPDPYVPTSIPERLTSMVLQILCPWLHLD